MCQELLCSNVRLKWNMQYIYFLTMFLMVCYNFFEIDPMSFSIVSPNQSHKQVFASAITKEPFWPTSNHLALVITTTGTDNILTTTLSSFHHNGGCECGPLRSNVSSGCGRNSLAEVEVKDLTDGALVV